MWIILGVVLVLCVVILYALCRTSGKADRKMEEILLRIPAASGHPNRTYLDTHSGFYWTPVPELTEQPFRYLLDIVSGNI